MESRRLRYHVTARCLFTLLAATLYVGSAFGAADNDCIAGSDQSARAFACAAPKNANVRVSVHNLALAIDDLNNALAYSARCLASTKEGTDHGEQLGNRCNDVQQWVKDAAAVPATAATLGITRAGSESPSMQTILVEQRRRYKVYKKWVRSAASDQSNYEYVETKLKPSLDQVRDNLYRLMEQAGLREDFAAELIQGVILQRTQDEPSESYSTLQPLQFRWKSRRFGHSYNQDRNLEFATSGRFGLVPALVLIRPASTTTGMVDSPLESQSTDDKGIVLDGRLDAILTLGQSTEFVLGTTLGQVWLDARKIVRKVNGTDTTFEIIVPPKGNSGIFYETGLSFRYFHRAVRDIRAEQPSIDPLLECGVSVRHDERFAGASTFGNPSKRLLLRFKLAGIPLVDTRKPESKPVTIGFGIEHERGLASGGLPSVTRVFLAADVSLVKALFGK